MSNPLASHHRLRIKPKVIHLVYTDLHTLPTSLPDAIFCQCPHPTHILCSGHPELLSLEQIKFIPGLLGLSISSLFLEISSPGTLTTSLSSREVFGFYSKSMVLFTPASPMPWRNLLIAKPNKRLLS